MQARFDSMLRDQEKIASELQRENEALKEEKESALRDASSEKAEMTAKIDAITAERDNAMRGYTMAEQTRRAQVQNLQTELQRVQSIVTNMQAQNNKLHQAVNVRSDQLNQVIARYNSAVEELNKRQNIIAELRTKINQDRQMETEFRNRMQRVQGIVDSMQAQNNSLRQTVEGRNDQLRQVIARYNSAVDELNRRQDTITELRTRINDEKQKQLETELRINSLNGEVVRRDISLSQRDNEIIALRNYISELEGRLGYAVGYQNNHTSSFEIAYRNDSAEDKADQA